MSTLNTEAKLVQYSIGSAVFTATAVGAYKVKPLWAKILLGLVAAANAPAPLLLLYTATQPARTAAGQFIASGQATPVGPDRVRVAIR